MTTTATATSRPDAQVTHSRDGQWTFHHCNSSWINGVTHRPSGTWIPYSGTIATARAEARSGALLDLVQAAPSSSEADPLAEPSVEATTYTVSLLPETDINHHSYALTVERRGPDSWAVLHYRWCLGVDGEWEFELRSSERTDEWIATHRFSRDRAIELAKAAAPDVTVNGYTAAQVLAATRG